MGRESLAWARALWISSGAVLVALAAGCADEETRFTYTDEGEICVRWRNAGSSSPVQSLLLSVTPSDCLSCCGYLVRSECDSTVSGDIIEVATTVVYAEVDYARDRPCCSACPDLSATCELPELEPGEYTVRLGDREFEFSLDAPLSRGECLGSTDADSGAN